MLSDGVKGREKEGAAIEIGETNLPKITAGENREKKRS